MYRLTIRASALRHGVYCLLIGGNMVTIQTTINQLNEKYLLIKKMFVNTVGIKSADLKDNFAAFRTAWM